MTIGHLRSMPIQTALLIRRYMTKISFRCNLNYLSYLDINRTVLHFPGLDFLLQCLTYSDYSSTRLACYVVISF